MTPDKLPVDVQKQIIKDAVEYADEQYLKRPTCGNELKEWETIRDIHISGATAWATWKVKHDELKRVLQEFVSNHEAGLLPNRFVYEKAIKVMNGEAETNKNKTMGNKELTVSYTKGEWYLQKYTDAYTNIVRCNNGKHETLFIASTPQSSLPEARANAQLISAAPDLLKALQEIVAITDRDHVAWTKAKTAIDKATGQFKDGKGKEKKLHSGNKHQWQDDWDLSEQGELNEETE